jgi:hypothetical protein
VPDVKANILILKKDLVSGEQHVHLLGLAGEEALILESLAQGEERNEPI